MTKHRIRNEELAALFEEMADLLELSGENPFRIRAYRHGAMAIAGLAQPVADLIAEGFDLTTIEGIGDTLAEKSKVIIETGHLPQLEKLRGEIPPTLRDIMRVPGLGAKKAMALFRELQVHDLNSLRSACESGAVAAIKGFGEKTQASILKNLEIVEKAAKRLSIDAADAIVARLREHFENDPEVEQLEFAGSYRRRKETVGDLDILVTSHAPTKVMDRFAEFPAIQEVLVRGDTKMSVRVSDSFQIDLRVVEPEAWGAALQYFTGSKEHNVHVRSLAKAKGLKVNEYGVFDADDETRRVAGKDEHEVYRAIGLPWIPPELRENRLEFGPDIQQRIKHLIELSDIRGDLHMHTTATDGEKSIEEMAARAQEMGLAYIAITDHSKRVTVARGLDDARALAQWREIDAINRKLDGSFHIFKGIECDILEDGSLDLSDECLKQADWVTASVHFGTRQTREQITDRIIGAIRHPSVHSISHPTGRLISRRDPYEIDLTAILQAAKEFDKCLEINANPERLDLNDVMASAAAEAGVMLVINTDAHSLSNLALMQYGVAVARRAGLTKEQVLNTRDLKSIRSWLKNANKFAE
ncbi:MAG: DNA polymerase/3'-5' exonuclease PolX [Planctomycetota bacterium]|jgi:DNA polymerase (family 10)